MKTLKHIILYLALLSEATPLIYAQETFKIESLTKLWETKEGLKVPESALFDAKRKVIYVSNINGGKEGSGFISKLSSTGAFVAPEWITNLNAPKGMGIFKDKLYVTSTKEVVEIDINLGVKLRSYTHPKALDLNDISIGRDGTVYISDTKGKCLFTVGKDSLQIFIESEETNKCNGLWANDNELLAGGSINKLIAINLKTKSIRTLADNTGYIDGLVATGKGSYIISDWKGKIQLVQPGKPVIKLLDTSSANINAADIDYIVKDKILLVPTFNYNKLVAYKLKL
jgi:hypothetical protein